MSIEIKLPPFEDIDDNGNYIGNDPQFMNNDSDFSLYEFTMHNKNGNVTKSTIPCDDWLHANRVKTELMKSKNLINVDFTKI